MTGVEIVLLVTGCVFMIGSFFITEKLSPSELNKIAELSQDELRRIVDNEIHNAGPRIEDAVDNQIDASSDLVQRALEKETNQKIMAISEFSDTVIENMNKTHNEIVFLYSMLNDKHTELTGMTADLQRLAADVRSLSESAAKNASFVQNSSASAPASLKKKQRLKTSASSSEEELAKTVIVTEESQENDPDELKVSGDTAEKEMQNDEQGAEQENHNRDILRMSKEGLSEIEIAKRLGLGVGEVKLVIGLYKGEIDL